MKKKFIHSIVVVIFLGALILPSCDSLGDCAQCDFVTDNAGNISSVPGPIYCGDNLTEKQNSTPVTIGDITTYWDCK